MKEFSNNPEVMDVLACIINGKTTSADIIKKVKQPQPTVATKLRILRDYNVITKKKWVFTPNWTELNNEFLKLIKSQITIWVSNKRKVNSFMKLFDEDRIKRILETYSEQLLTYNVEMKSIKGIILDYLIGLSQTDAKRLKKLDKRFVDLKELITYESMQKALFIESEEIGIGAE